MDRRKSEICRNCHKEIQRKTPKSGDKMPEPGTRIIKVLNLYAGIGGNRKQWPNDEIEVTAIEINPEIATIYHDFFPKDNVIVADAHQYLLEHFKEFDFIWSSPPCPTHSRMRNLKNVQDCKDVYPDMQLYQEILLLKHFFNGKSN